MSPTIALVLIVCVAGGCREVRREPARSAAVDQDRPQPAKTAAVDAGSCEEAFRALFNDKPVQLFRGVKPSAERIRGDVASVDFKHPGQTESAITVCAKKTPDGWLAADVPDSEAP